MKILFVIDMQNDFINGELGSPEAQAIVPKVVEKIQQADKNEDFVVFTQDTHYDNYLNTQEGKYLPIPHCIFDTPGWFLEDSIFDAIFLNFHHIDNIYEVTKETFGYPWSIEMFNQKTVADNPTKEYHLTENDIDKIEIVGLNTDFCVLANAMTLKAAFPNVPITIDAACCAGSTPEWHEKALDMLEHCHFNVINRNKE